MTSEVKKYTINEPWLNTSCGLGEGPFWEESNNALRFVDIINKKLFFADLGDPADVVALARERARRHRHWLEVYRSLRAGLDPSDRTRLVSRARILKLGILHEQAYVDFWESLAADPDSLDVADGD